jgi:hypothetical protein
MGITFFSRRTTCLRLGRVLLARRALAQACSSNPLCTNLRSHAAAAAATAAPPSRRDALARTSARVDALRHFNGRPALAGGGGACAVGAAGLSLPAAASGFALLDASPLSSRAPFTEAANVTGGVESLLAQLRAECESWRGMRQLLAEVD